MNNDRTSALFAQINAGFSNRCVELVREGKSAEAAALHGLHRKFVALVMNWRADGEKKAVAP